ncbi:MAG: YbjN domain-containing protein [Deltaproteobacteria bacterium]|nr:YbjN domain-containing protein [Deltaproteobacteria bacterium]
MAFEVTEVATVLQGLKWEPRALDERTWRCTLTTSVGTVKLVVRHAGAWLYVSVIPFFEAGSVKKWGRNKYPVGFLGRLLAVNRNLTMAKFALDDDGDIVLQSELPTESLTPALLANVAQLLLRTTEQYRAPVRDALLDAGRAASE